jgi:adenylate cyclase
MAIDWAAEGLLDGLEGADRASRVELLEALVEEGVSLEEIERAAGDGSLLFLLAAKAIDLDARYTWTDLVQRSGLDEDLVRRLVRAQGFPLDVEGPAYTDSDLAMLHRTGEFLQAGVPEDDLVTVGRLLGRGFQQAAEAMRGTAMRMVLEPGLGERELAVRYAQAAGVLTPMMEPLLANLLRLHLSKLVQTEIISAEEREAGRLAGAREVVVAFADLVGFTRLGEEVPPDELGAVAGRLEQMVVDVLCPPVRFVKTIGDAVMLVSPDAEPLLDTALDLVEVADGQGEAFPQLRVGAAAGEALSRAGDWFGRPVNLASRVTTIARPGSVLTTEAVQDVVADRYRWSKAGIRHLKGVPGPVPLWRARRLEEEA